MLADELLLSDKTMIYPYGSSASTVKVHNHLLYPGPYFIRSRIFRDSRPANMELAGQGVGRW